MRPRTGRCTLAEPLSRRLANHPGSVRPRHTMTATPQQELDLRWFVPVFACGWLGICCLLSVIGGWHALATRYRSTLSSSGKLFPFASMGLGRGFSPVSYGSCLFVRLDSTGIELSVLPMFRFFHPKLLIPWSAVSDCRRERYWFVDCTALYIAEPQVRMLFRGRLGREIFEARGRAV